MNRALLSSISTHAIVAVTGLSLMSVPSIALAQVSIGTGTTQVRTSTAGTGNIPSDVVITSGSTRTMTGEAGLIVDSANNATNSGTITRTDTASGQLVIVKPGTGGSYTNFGTLTYSDGYTRTDTNADGNLDGAFANGTNRIGILVGEVGDTTTATLALSTGALTVNGNQSAGVRLVGPFVGNIATGLSFSTIVTGDGSTGLDFTGPITGTVDIRGGVGAQGVGNHAINFAGPVTGSVTLAGALGSTGYSSTQRGTTTANALLGADDLGQSGATVLVGASITQGLYLAGIGQENDPDDDADGILDTDTTAPDSDDNRTVSINSYGSAAGLDISGASPIAIGANARFGYSLVNRGSVIGQGVYDGVSSTSIHIGPSVTLTNGFLNQGAVTTAAFAANSTAINIDGANIGTFRNTGNIASTATDGNGAVTTALLIGAGSTLTSFNNSGIITANVAGGNGTAYGIRDLSGSLTNVTNTGIILGILTETTTDSGTVSGTAVGIDLSNAASNISLTQNAAFVDTEDDSVDNVVAVAPFISGDVRLGAFNDVFTINSGSVISNIYFGAGADRLNITGGSVDATLFDSDSNLSLNLTGGTLITRNSSPIALTSLDIGSGAKWQFGVDLNSGSVGTLNVSGTANVASGANIGPIFNGARSTPLSINLISASTLNLTGGLPTVSLDTLPYLYNATVSQTSTALNLLITPKTASQLGLSPSEANALPAILALAGAQADVSNVINGAVTAANWQTTYKRLLPDYTDGRISMALAATRGANSVSRDMVSRLDNSQPGILSWGQQYFFGENRDSTTDQSREGSGFGFITGAGSALGPFDLVGVTAHFNAGTYNRGISNAEQAEIFSLSSMGIGGIIAYGESGFRFDAEASYDWTKATSDRRVFLTGQGTSTGVDQTLTSHWNGTMISYSAEASYEHVFGSHIFARPFARLDAVHLSEDPFKESGGTSLAVEMGEFKASRSQGRAGLEAGYTSGTDDEGIRFFVAGGAVNTLNDNIDDRQARFVAAGSWFDLIAPTDEDTGTFASIGMRISGVAGAGTLKLDGEQVGNRTNISLTASFRYRF